MDYDTVVTYNKSTAISSRHEAGNRVEYPSGHNGRMVKKVRKCFHEKSRRSMKSRITRLGSLAGAIAMIVILPGCSSQQSSTKQISPLTYTPKPMSASVAASMDAYKKMAGMSPQQQAQYKQDHPELGTTPTRADE